MAQDIKLYTQETKGKYPPLMCNHWLCKKEATSFVVCKPVAYDPEDGTRLVLEPLCREHLEKLQKGILYLVGNWMTIVVDHLHVGDQIEQEGIEAIMARVALEYTLQQD